MASLYHIPKELISSKNFSKSAPWKLVLDPFVFPKNSAQPQLENEIFEAIYLYYIFNSKAIKISPNQHAGLIRFLLTDDSLKIKKVLELVSRPNFSNNFLIKKFIWHVYFPSYSIKCVSCFMLRHFMTSWHLNIWKFKDSLS